MVDSYTHTQDSENPFLERESRGTCCTTESLQLPAAASGPQTAAMKSRTTSSSKVEFQSVAGSAAVHLCGVSSVTVTCDTHERQDWVLVCGLLGGWGTMANIGRTRRSGFPSPLHAGVVRCVQEYIRCL